MFRYRSRTRPHSDLSTGESLIHRSGAHAHGEPGKPVNPQIPLVTWVVSVVSIISLFWLNTTLAVLPLGELVFRDGQERTTQVVFQRNGSGYQLPTNPASDQLSWLLSELVTGENTSISEIQAHFTTGFNAADTANFINDLRATFPNAIITDVVTSTPMETVVVIESPGGGNPKGYVTLRARFTGSQNIHYLLVSNYAGSVQYAQHQGLTLEQTADQWTSLAQNTSVLVAQINDQHQCEPLVSRNADVLMATASIFKVWVLGGVTDAVANGQISVSDLVSFVASERTPGGSQINNEPLGTLFTVDELATLMLGISDNTATDLLHEAVGRTVIHNFIDTSGVANPNTLKPLLNINEQFHLFYSFPLATALNYVQGSENFQQDFLNQQIIPLGPVTDTSSLNDSLLAEGSWQASALDICAGMAKHRITEESNGAMGLVNRALSAGIAQPEVRSAFDRTWFKGGSFYDGNQNNRVWTLAWLLESNGQFPYVVVAMANNPTPGHIDTYVAQSLTSRMIQIIAESQ